MAGLCARGHTVELLTIREARAIEPSLSPALLGAMYSPLRSQADPVKATRAFARLAEREGARVLTEHEVRALTPRSSGGEVLIGAAEARARVARHILDQVVKALIEERRRELGAADDLGDPPSRG